MQTNAPQGQITNNNNIKQAQPQAQPQVQAQQPAVIQTQPVMQPYITRPVVQTVTPPQGQSYAGVNIQIFNPAVGTPGAAPVYNVNAPTYGPYGTGLGDCYPSNYYTQDFKPQPQNGNTNNETTNTITNKTVNETENKTTDKKTEKRQIVQLTDNYIKTLENYLNSQDLQVRLMGAKEVVARAQEDESRKDDKALTALTNKMLQDPAQEIRILALGLLDSRAITGDDYTVGVLTKMQNSKEGYGQDALSATNILLKMAGKTVEKEFEVKDKPQKTEENKK